MSWRERIERNPEILVGKPVIKGTRISVELIMDLLANEWTEEDILDNYAITRDDILACFEYARDLLTEFRHFPLPAREKAG